MLSLVILVIAIGLNLRKIWAKYLWNLASFSITILWLFYVLRTAFYRWPYATFTESFIALIPGFSLIIFFVCGSVAIHKEFGIKRERQLQ